MRRLGQNFFLLTSHSKNYDSGVEICLNTYNKFAKWETKTNKETPQRVY